MPHYCRIVVRRVSHQRDVLQKYTNLMQHVCRLDEPLQILTSMHVISAFQVQQNAPLGLYYAHGSFELFMRLFTQRTNVCVQAKRSHKPCYVL